MVQSLEAVQATETYAKAARAINPEVDIPGFYDLIRAHVFAGSRIHGDDTPVPVIAKGHTVASGYAVKPLDPVTKPLSWTNDVDITFDPKMVSYKVVLKLYTGISYNISSEKDVPYSLFDVLADKDRIKFRPRPQCDF